MPKIAPFGIRGFQEEKAKGKDHDQVAAAAEFLGLKPTTLLSRIKKMRIVKVG